MLGVAMAMMCEPELLLLDEPASGLGNDEIQNLESVLRDLRTHGTTLCIIDHKVAFLAKFADQAIALQQGCKIAEGRAARRAGRSRRGEGLSRSEAIMLELSAISAHYAKNQVLRAVDLSRCGGRGGGTDRSQRRRQIDDDAPDRRVEARHLRLDQARRHRDRNRCRRHGVSGSASHWCPRAARFLPNPPSSKI